MENKTKIQDKLYSCNRKYKIIINNDLCIKDLASTYTLQYEGIYLCNRAIINKRFT